MFEAIAKPFGQFLMLLYSWVGNYGVALIFFAVAIRIILLPFQMKSKPGMMRQARLQPKVAELQKKYASNKAKLNEEMAKFYKEEGVNPASGCLWSFLPLPILFALFLVIRQPLTMMMGISPELLEEGGAIFERLQFLVFKPTIQQSYIQLEQAQFISEHFASFQVLDIPGLRTLNFNFLGINLGAQPQFDFLWTTNWSNSSVWLPGLALFLIPLLSGGSQFAATAINRKLNPAFTPEGQGKSMQVMMMLMPLLSVYFAFITPAALGFYWTVGTVIQVAQDVWLTKRYTKKLDAEDALKNEERLKKEAELEAKRLETERRKAEGLAERNPSTSKKKKQKSEKQGQLDRAAEWEKKNAPDEEPEKIEPSRVDHRRFARGRSYDPDRYSGAAKDRDADGDSESETRGLGLLGGGFDEDDNEYEETDDEAEGLIEEGDFSEDEDEDEDDDDDEDEG